MKVLVLSVYPIMILWWSINIHKMNNINILSSVLAVGLLEFYVLIISDN